MKIKTQILNNAYEDQLDMCNVTKFILKNVNLYLSITLFLWNQKYFKLSFNILFTL